MAKVWAAKVHEQRRDTGEASESVARKIWLLLELLRHQIVHVSEYERLHQRDRRSFQRDLQQLRAIGKSAGFAISNIEQGELVRLTALDQRIRRLDGARAPLLRLIAEVARTLGEPIRGELESIADAATAGEVFLHIHAPELVEGSSVAKVYARLKDAWESAAGAALVRFRYRTAAGGTEERLVDPYRVIVRSGRYFLIGYDAGRRAWRFFALDAIIGLPVKAGTIRTQRQIPADYAATDTVGFLKGRGKPVEVTVELSPTIAVSATSRVWNHAQRVEKLPGGRARITIPVSDPLEVIRWTFGFGADARVTGPPDVVVRAHKLLDEMKRAHAP